MLVQTMSCASPISQLSPPLHMYNATLLSPHRSPLDDADPLHLQSSFSFSFSAAPPTPHLLSSSALSPSPAASRPVLSDIRLERHKNAPQSPGPLSKATTAAHVPCLCLPRRCCKENWENAGKAERDDAENAGLIDPLCPSSSLLPFKTRGTGNVQKNDIVGKGSAPVGGLSRSSPSPLKRKRPTKLAIPELARLASFGKAKDFMVSEQEQETHSFETPLYAVSCRRGKKDCMEDAHTAITNFQGKPNQAFFGVFDGHGGKIAAKFAAENLGRHIDFAIRSLKDEEESLEEAMQAGYLATDSEFLAKDKNSGACSISAFVKEGQLMIANAGDCKAVLCRDGKAEALSNLHRASDVEERQRIESLGGYVDCFNGVWRVQGTLAVTRAFGDSNLKQWVTADPEVRQVDITRGCEFLILASDGLWDKVSDQEAVDCAKEFLQNLAEEDEALDSPESSRPSKAPRHHHCSTIPSSTDRKDNGETLAPGKTDECDQLFHYCSSIPSSRDRKNNGETSLSSGKTDACNQLIHKAYSRGNLDDITVMLVPLKGFVMPR